MIRLESVGASESAPAPGGGTLPPGQPGLPVAGPAGPPAAGGPFALAMPGQCSNFTGKLLTAFKFSSCALALSLSPTVTVTARAMHCERLVTRNMLDMHATDMHHDASEPEDRSTSISPLAVHMDGHGERSSQLEFTPSLLCHI